MDSAVAAATSSSLEVRQFRWVIIFYHANAEIDRTYGDIWYDTLQECENAASELDFSYCCGFSFEFEKRVKPVQGPVC